jgi:hypothetical protein
MPNAKGLRKGGPGFSNESTWVEGVYDFAVDSGATGTYNLVEIGGDCVVTQWYAVVETALTSVGAVTLSAGYTGSLTAFLSSVAKASVTQNAVLIPNASGDLPARVTSGAFLTVGLGAAVATAGKITVRAQITKSYAAD